MSTRNSINSIKGSALQDRRSAVEPAGIGSKSAACVVTAARPAVVVTATRPVSAVSATRPVVVSATRPAAVVTGHIPVEDQQVETRLITKVIATGAAEPQTARSE
ncbi:hypothetical protein [Paenarthrobacter sp. NPDC091669]|uniref:hypothetical protein n=1 Tax=Paenarthrobacter sp. NPDC091669 TaxID=3364384 RepID=UPI0038249FFA